MSIKIQLILLAALGLILILGARTFLGQIKEISQIRQSDISHYKSVSAGQQSIEIKSTAFENGDYIPKEYTCDGADINPRLEFSNIPPDAKSLVLIVDDLHSVGKDWNHWLIWNISAETTSIGMRSIPQGARVGMNDFGEFGYSGPCPPSGEHRYLFQLFAIDKELDYPSSSSRDVIQTAIEGHIIEKAGLMGRYARDN